MPLTASPMGPMMPKLQQNRNTMAANRTISPISWNRALSWAAWALVFFLWVEVFFLLWAVLLFEDAVFLPLEAAIYINLTCLYSREQ